mmetsp:Transcript_35498/g.81255  ORF Transcript_35498/g.81255 Transcript_35498/m.81255 type:complete len:86 (+) Transcript_35498:1181-1438(+)
MVPEAAQLLAPVSKVTGGTYMMPLCRTHHQEGREAEYPPECCWKAGFLLQKPGRASKQREERASYKPGSNASKALRSYILQVIVL